MLRECIYGECAHEQHVRRTLTLTLTDTITAYSRVQGLGTRLPLPERPGSVVLILRPTTRVTPGGSSTSAFLVNVDARRPADTPFYRR